MTRNIAVFVGSLRKEAFSKKVANAIMDLATAGFHMEIIEIGQLPLYNQDLDENPPDSWTEFRNRVKAFDALIFITPEYNRSVPAALKNALDVGSRPAGQSVWGGKPAAVISVSPGQYGGFGANHHLRQSFVFLDIPVMQQPETYLAKANELFDENGALINEKTREHFKKFMDSFAIWVEKNSLL
jgi:chromate reductase, NAD(P)H dehydrogenase (quinone)